MRGLRLAQLAAAVLFAAALSYPASAGPVLVSGLSGVDETAWRPNHDQQNMNQVFGTGAWTFYDSYGAADPALIFTSATPFVFLEGGVETYSDLDAYLSANGAAIMDWVNAGGRLLLMSAGPSGLGVDASIEGFGPGNLIFDEFGEPTSISNCGTVTAAGLGALSFDSTPGGICGHELAADYVSGNGLTDFMDGFENGLPLVAGAASGGGYVMYAGLTDSQFHDGGDCLVDNVIATTANVDGPRACSRRQQGVPEPFTLALFGAGLAGLGSLRRRAPSRR